MDAHVITGLCVGVKDKGCVPACPIDCIYEGERQLYIHPNDCIYCGACVAECPVKAIFPGDEVPIAWKGSIQEAADFFEKGLPGSTEPARP